METLYEKIPKISEVFVLTNTVGNEKLIQFISELSKINRYSMLGKNGIEVLEKLIDNHTQDTVFEILDNFISALTICNVDINVIENLVTNHNLLFANEKERLTEQVIPSKDVKFYHYVFYVISICIVHILDVIKELNKKQ